MENLKRLREMWAQRGVESRLDVVEGVGHSSEGARECVLDFLRPLMQAWYREQDAEDLVPYS